MSNLLSFSFGESRIIIDKLISTYRFCFPNKLTMYLLKIAEDHQDVIPGILPFFHIYGLSVILLRGLSNGCKIVSLPKFETTGFLSILKDKKVTTTCNEYLR